MVPHGFLALTLLFAAQGRTQLFWTATVDGSNSVEERANCVAIDGAGSIILGGFYSGNASPSRSDSMTLVGNTDGYIVKYLSNGSYAWKMRFTGLGNEEIVDVAADAMGLVYVAGDFTTPAVSLIAADGTVSTISNALPGNEDTFVLKISPTGSIVWTTRISGTGSETPTGIAIDARGNVVVVGIISGIVNIYDSVNPSIIWSYYNPYASSNVPASFVVKFASDGTFVWATRCAATGGMVIASVAVNANEEVAIGGKFRGDAQLMSFDTTTRSFTPNIGGDDGFVAVLNSVGIFGWSVRIAGTNNDGINSIAYSDRLVIAAGVTKSLSVTLSYSDATSSRTWSVPSNVFSPLGGILLSYSSTGSLVWRTRIDVLYDSLAVTRVAVDSGGIIHLGGSFKANTIAFYNSNDTLGLASVSGFTSNAYDTGFIASYTSLGTYSNWARYMSNPTNGARINDFVRLAEGHVAVGDLMTSLDVFIPYNNGTSLVSIGRNNRFDYAAFLVAPSVAPGNLAPIPQPTRTTPSARRSSADPLQNLSLPRVTQTASSSKKGDGRDEGTDTTESNSLFGDFSPAFVVIMLIFLGLFLSTPPLLFTVYVHYYKRLPWERAEKSERRRSSRYSETMPMYSRHQ